MAQTIELKTRLIHEVGLEQGHEYSCGVIYFCLLTVPILLSFCLDAIASNRYPVMVLIQTDIFFNAIAIIFQMRILLDEQRPRALNIPRLQKPCETLVKIFTHYNFL
ncbi:MAG: hypothetical protein ACKPJO_11280 [Dolichospermum sp.]